MSSPIACTRCHGTEAVPVNACQHSPFSACPMCGPDEEICRHCAYTPGIEPCEWSTCRNGAVATVDGEHLCAEHASALLQES